MVDLPISVNPNRWTRIKQFVHFIKTTNERTILAGWEKTKLTDGMEFDNEMLMNEDAQEELMIQEGMERMMIEDDGQGSDVEEVANVSNEVALLPATSDNDKKKERQSQITDFFKTA